MAKEKKKVSWWAIVLIIVVVLISLNYILKSINSASDLKAVKELLEKDGYNVISVEKIENLYSVNMTKANTNSIIPNEQITDGLITLEVFFPKADYYMVVIFIGEIDCSYLISGEVARACYENTMDNNPFCTSIDNEIETYNRACNYRLSQK